jgi:hypothetical protein
MPKRAINQQQFTAVASTLVAILVLTIGVTASQKTSEPTSSLAALESDLQFQFEMAFRHDTDEQDRRQAQLDRVMQKWNASPRTPADEHLLVQWLNESMSRSLPGAVAPLPPIPEFSQQQVAATEAPGKLGPPQAMVPATLAEPTPAPKPLATNEPITPTPIEKGKDDVLLQQPPTVVSAGPPILPEENLPIAPLPTARLLPTATAVPDLADPIEPASAPTPVQTVSVSQPVSVNLVELAARIGGYHDSLDAVETALLGQDQPDLGFLSQQVEQLDLLTRDWHLISLYYRALTAQEQEGMLAPRSMEPTLQEVRRQLRLYEKQQDSDFLGSFDRKEAEQLAAIQDKLAEITKRVTGE